MSTAPCTECRRLRKRCIWPNQSADSSKQPCLTCARHGKCCSGSVLLRPGPCESCKRSKVRCVWTTTDRCNRCIEHGSEICPMPARKRLARPRDLEQPSSPQVTIIVKVPQPISQLSPYSPRSVTFAEITYLNSAVHALRHMSSINLHMYGRPYNEEDVECQMALDNFCESLARLSGLMFSELQIDNVETNGSIRAISVDSSPGAGPSRIIPTISGDVTDVADIGSVTQRTWSQLRLIRRDRTELVHRDWWLKFSSALRLLRALRLTPDSEADRDLLRVCLTETGVQCLQYAAESTSSKEESAGLRMVARSLMVEEANLACILRKSSLFPDPSASATLPALIRVASWDELSLDVSGKTVRSILLPPATCCISRTAHAVAANHYRTLDALFVALSELKIAHEHTRRLSEAMLYGSRGPPSDPESRDMARSVIKTRLWALETWTNLLVRVKEAGEGWSGRHIWLAEQVGEIQAYVAEACDGLLLIFDRFSDLYQGCDTARMIIEVHLQEFPECCSLPGTAIATKLLHVFDVAGLWNNKAIKELGEPNGIWSHARGERESGPVQ